MQLQALKDMHYNTRIGIYGGHPFSKQLIRVISLIGLFLLLIACVNFVNLATAQAVNRSKEVGIRKVLGSNRPQLVLQFISETLIITLFAILFAAAIANYAAPGQRAAGDQPEQELFVKPGSYLVFSSSSHRGRFFGRFLPGIGIIRL